ncbi:hypothetical protein [Kitasatospora aureofaciens]|uniref:hypothetical protein n=1 Tax=Kitasatospora aureofaciens TaxID=1894 RepID=UPI0033EA781F
MRAGTAAFLIGAAFAVLLSLAFATVALGVITALRMLTPDDERTDLQNQPPSRRIPV